MTFSELGIVLAYFLLAVVLVLVVGYLLGWGRSFGSRRMVDRLDQAGSLVSHASVVFVIAGILVAFTGYAMDQSMIARIGAVMIGAGLPLLLVAEHWGSASRRRT